MTTRARGRGGLLHASLHIMLATVLTGGLGYLFWTVAARTWTARQVGIASGAVALCTALSLAVHLGPAALLIERLPRWEGHEGWGRRVWTALLATAAGSALLAGAALAVGRHSALLTALAHSWLGAAAFVVGCSAWSGVSVLNYTVLACRRTEQMSVLNAAVSALKLAALPALGVLVGTGSTALLLAWAASALLGCVLAVVWQLPRIGRPLGRPRLLRPGRGTMIATIGHHLTSVGGVLTPYVLPPLVAWLLDPEQVAYFTLTWMLGSLFFMISPAVAGAMFAEGVRDPSALAAAVRRCGLIIAALLGPAALVMLLAGRLFLGLFGPGYVEHGAALLVVLVLSTVPDAVTNIAVSVLRVTGELWRATALNLGMGLLAVAGTVLLGPRIGVLGVGLAWALAQCLGAAWAAPGLVRLLRLRPEGSPGAPAQPSTPGARVGATAAVMEAT